MTQSDFDHIEATLGITLPEVYKRLMNPYPIRYLGGNSDTDLWDDPTRIISINQSLRGELSSWPSHWFVIGDPLSGAANVMDLRDPLAPVHWLDRCNLASIGTAAGTPFEEWFDRFIVTARADLEKDGMDPDGDPPPSVPVSATAKWVLAGIVVSVLVLAAIGLGLSVYDWLK